jgi:hypothetical protein
MPSTLTSNTICRQGCIRWLSFRAKTSNWILEKRLNDKTLGTGILDRQGNTWRYNKFGIEARVITSLGFSVKSNSLAREDHGIRVQESLDTELWGKKTKYMKVRLYDTQLELLNESKSAKYHVFAKESTADVPIPSYDKYTQHQFIGAKSFPVQQFKRSEFESLKWQDRG